MIRIGIYNSLKIIYPNRIKILTCYNILTTILKHYKTYSKITINDPKMTQL